METRDKKTCSKCKEVMPISEFYKKGTRVDSSCKTCQKEKKKAKYVVTKNHDVATGLKSIVDITVLGLSERIRAEVEKLDEVMSCLQKIKR